MALGILSLPLCPSAPLPLYLSLFASLSPPPLSLHWSRINLYHFHMDKYGKQEISMSLCHLRQQPESSSEICARLLIQHLLLHLLLLLLCLPGWHYPFNPLWLVTCCFSSDSITSAICHLAYNLCEAATIDGQQMRHSGPCGEAF